MTDPLSEAKAFLERVERAGEYLPEHAISADVVAALVAEVERLRREVGALGSVVEQHEYLPSSWALWWAP